MLPPRTAVAAVRGEAGRLPGRPPRLVGLGVFSGAGGVAEEFRRHGLTSLEFDVIHGPGGDLTRPSTLARVRDLIRSGRVTSAMLAPPCSSFSRARVRTGPLRSKELPWGVRGFSPKDQELVRIGNLCARAAIQITKWRLRYQFFCVVEHSDASRL